MSVRRRRREPRARDVHSRDDRERAPAAVRVRLNGSGERARRKKGNEEKPRATCHETRVESQMRTHVSNRLVLRRGVDWPSERAARLVTAAQAQHEVERRLLLDVVVREGAAVLELLTREDQALLVRGDACVGKRAEGEVSTSAKKSRVRNVAPPVDRSGCRREVRSVRASAENGRESRKARAIRCPRKHRHVRFLHVEGEPGNRTRAARSRASRIAQGKTTSWFARE